uniref:4'-phosphopantetheinyl transferase superfamily protein n=1 Tax=Prevotella sp. GTC17253 TaxID=3236793 RepID=A0AB33IY01_9BACT
MALIRVETLSEDVLLGLWKIDEVQAIDFLTMKPQLIPIYEALISKYKSLGRQLEQLAIYSLLDEMKESAALSIINHHENGKPFYEGYYISISHTRGYAALILSKEQEVSIDIEYVNNRVERISGRFIRPDEQSASLDEKLINWSIKETVYKYYSTQQLGFFDIRLLPYELKEEGIIIVKNMKSEEQLAVCYRMTPDYVLTYYI